MFQRSSQCVHRYDMILIMSLPSSIHIFLVCSPLTIFDTSVKQPSTLVCSLSLITEHQHPYIFLGNPSQSNSKPLVHFPCFRLPGNWGSFRPSSTFWPCLWMDPQLLAKSTSDFDVLGKLVFSTQFIVILL